MSAVHRRHADSLEVERFRALIASPAFAALTMRMEQLLERSRRDIESREEPVNVYRGQGRVSAIRDVLALPGAMLSEMEKKQ